MKKFFSMMMAFLLIVPVLTGCSSEGTKSVTTDGSTVFHTDYLLSNNDFLILYKEIMGKEVFEFPSLVNPSSEWLDKMQSDLEYENYISSIRKE